MVNDNNNTSNTFGSVVDSISLSIKKVKEQIETDLTEALSNYLKSSDSEGLGFVPSLRNILGIFYANTEAFLRLLDDVHTQAWQESGSKYRKAAVLNTQTKTANPDYLEGEDTPVYPWPSFVVPNKDKDGQEKYKYTYPGDPDYIKITNANNPTVWPEVKFVEELIKGLTQTTDNTTSLPPTADDVNDVKRVSLNPIEFPISNQVYQNKEETKFFYEIWERIYLVSYYSNLSRSVNSGDYGKILSTIVATEVTNLTKCVRWQIHHC